jgi:hypothetical protein
MEGGIVKKILFFKNRTPNVISQRALGAPFVGWPMDGALIST